MLAVRRPVSQTFLKSFLRDATANRECGNDDSVTCLMWASRVQCGLALDNRLGQGLSGVCSPLPKDESFTSK